MTLAPVRLPAVAGRFYPADDRTLMADVARYLGTPAPEPRIGLMAPHAGYVYSGGVAGKTFRLAKIPKQVVILAPNHTGRGVPVSVLGATALRIPGADVPVDADLVTRILRDVPGATLDLRAHEREHAAEVEVPFLVALRPDVAIVPIVLGGLGGVAAAAVGRGLARALDGLDVLVVASSDMNHYLPDDVTRKRDKLAIDKLLALDPQGLYDTVEANDISMCGVLPATAMLAYARERGATRADLAAYATSGDAFGDRSAVVGYAGVLVS